MKGISKTMPNNIKQIKIGDVTYDINAVKLEGHSYQDIIDLVSAGFTIEVPWTSDMAKQTTAPSAAQLAKIPEGVNVTSAGGSGVGTLEANAAGANKHLYLVYHNHSTGDTFDEYVSTGSVWEKIGNTDIDLSNYVTYGKKYTTGAASGNTGSAGGATVTTSEAAVQTASGSATITYQKADATTGSAGGQTIKPTFTGTAATITLSGNVSGTAVADHEYTPGGTISGSQAIGAHSHTINVATPTTASFVTGVSGSGTATAVTGITTTTETAMTGAVVSTDGVLSFTGQSFVQTAKASTTAAVLTGVKATGTAKAVTAIGAITSSSAGGVTVDFTKATFTGTAATITHAVTQGKATVSGSYTPKGAISDVVIAAHTHSIGSASTTVTGTASVTVAKHSHTVTIANHVHSLNNHTHSVTLEK